MSVTDLSARRWAAKESPKEHSVRDMLVEAIRMIDAGELPATHAILAHSTIDDDGMGVTVGWLQAGDLPPLGQLGLLTRAAQIMGGEG